ncbi:hypothetical protein CDD83_6342 [Cordyceps sp. RAO-2017]|nr:hypothetical protein CDD83_6342 [Cordyceps sp. RAO-2017]
MRHRGTSKSSRAAARELAWQELQLSPLIDSEASLNSILELICAHSRPSDPTKANCRATGSSRQLGRVPPRYGYSVYGTTGQIRARHRHRTARNKAAMSERSKDSRVPEPRPSGTPLAGGGSIWGYLRGGPRPGGTADK